MLTTYLLTYVILYNVISLDDFAIYRGHNTAVLSLQTCGVYEVNRWNLPADGNAKTTAFVNYIRNLDPEVVNNLYTLILHHEYLIKASRYYRLIYRPFSHWMSCWSCSSKR